MLQYLLPHKKANIDTVIINEEARSFLDENPFFESFHHCPNCIEFNFPENKNIIISYSHVLEAKLPLTYPPPIPPHPAYISPLLSRYDDVYNIDFSYDPLMLWHL